MYVIHYSTLKINETVKLVKLFEKMFNVSFAVLDNSFVPGIISLSFLSRFKFCKVKWQHFKGVVENVTCILQ